MSEDYPEYINRQRNLLRPVLAAAKSKGIKASLVAEKVRINDKFYGVDQIKDLPPDLNPEKGCIHENDDTICFYGRYTPLSNFFKCDLTVNGQKYNCVEQFVQSRKAEILNADATAQRILLTSDPVDQKALTRTLDDHKHIWNKVAESEVKPAIYAKFTQNADLLNYLISTVRKTFGRNQF